MNIRELGLDDKLTWAELRKQLWPQESVAQHSEEIERIFGSTDMVGLGLFLDQKLIGLAELSLRNIVDGCLSSPVVYIEAWVIHQDYRGQGWGKKLIERAKQWGISKGCTEMGSDTEVTRLNSIKAHKALGFEEVDRVVNFRLSLMSLPLFFFF